jgi:tetratricopeptide (TPR) repeat protein
VRAALFLVLAGLLIATASLCAEPPTKEQVARWIKELGDDDFATREQASKSLWQAGSAAESAVFEALKSGDVEVVRRAGALAAKFKWGHYPDTPPAVVERIGRYRVADEAGKQAVIKELFQLGSAGSAAILKIAAAEEKDVRPRVFEQIARDAVTAVPDLLLEGKLDTLGQFLEISTATGRDSCALDYAAYCAMRGKIDEEITAYNERLRSDDPGRARLVLLFLHRTRGDLTSARLAAAKMERPDVEQAILAEAGDWKSLSQFEISEIGRPLVALGFKAAYQRLAGDTVAFDHTIEQIRTSSDATGERKWGAWAAARMLLLNDRPQEALDLLSKHRRSAVFELLCAQMRFREAFALVDKVRAEQRPEVDVELGLLEVLQARTLHLLGDKEKAAKLFAELGARIVEGQEAAWHEKLIDVERKLGLRELACDHCARVLAITKNEGRQASALAKAFPGRGDTAMQWWQFLRRGKMPSPEAPREETAAETMKRLHALVEGRIQGKALDDIVGSAKVLHPDPAAARWMLAIYEIYLNAGMEERAKEYLDAAASSLVAPAPRLRYGDFLAERKKWELAAAQYGKAWDLDRKEPLSLYLKGWALAQAGQEQEGKRLMDLAHWLPLGNESARFAFIAELSRRRHRDAVRREAELLVRFSVPGSFYAGEGFRQLALAAFQRGDHLKAAAYHELAMLRCLRPQTNFAETTAYLGVPHFVHRHRAAGLLAAGRTGEALKEAEICLAAMPGNSELQSLLVPELEKRGHEADADSLFARCYDLHAATCRDYPNSAWAHNALAWTCASARRNLNEAFEHARKAVALEPSNPGYHDTLAEVYFQRGDAAEAIEEIQRSIALDGKRAYFQKQLKRFKAGDPKAALPPASDEE